MMKKEKKKEEEEEEKKKKKKKKRKKNGLRTWRLSLRPRSPFPGRFAASKPRMCLWNGAGQDPVALRLEYGLLYQIALVPMS